MLRDGDVSYAEARYARVFVAADVYYVRAADSPDVTRLMRDALSHHAAPSRVTLFDMPRDERRLHTIHCFAVAVLPAIAADADLRFSPC